MVTRDLLGWDTLSICDWSEIPHLELTNVSNVALTEGLPPGELTRLKTLILACECWDRAEMQNQLQKLSDFLDSLLGYTSDLEKLALKCGVCDFHRYRRGAFLTIKSEEYRKPNDCIPAIARNCQSLCSLDPRKFDGPRSFPRKWILLSTTYLEVVRCSCPALMELSLDAKVYLYDRRPRLVVAVNAALATFRNIRRLMVYTLIPYLPPDAGLLPHHQPRAVAPESIEILQRLKQGAIFERLTMNVEIERLVADDEYQRINDDEDWRVFLSYTCEVEKGVSWSITGEDRSLEFIRR